MICQYCKYTFPDYLGKYGCPNCEGYSQMKNSYYTTPRRSEDCTFHSWADPIHVEEPSWRKDPDTLIMAFCAAGFIFMIVYLLMGY